MDNHVFSRQYWKRGNAMDTLSLTDEPKRSCFGCSACCEALIIHEIKKPAHQPCPNCSTGVACDIYQDRYNSCRGFGCFWLHGSGAENDRPDKSGVVSFLAIKPSGIYVTMSEYRAGALDDPGVRTQTQELLGWDVIVTHMPIGKRLTTYVPERRVESPW